VNEMLSQLVLIFVGLLLSLPLIIILYRAVFTLYALYICVLEKEINAMAARLG